MLARFLKPNWQHPKPDKRVKAVAKLRPTDAKAQPILSQLALEDRDELVRLNATEKLLNLNLLIKISKQDPSANIQQQALHRISQILLSQEIDISGEEKQSALASLKESNFLTHIALNSHDASLREQAIRQLNDSTNLAVIAEKSQRASVRLLAAEKISCPETLERLSKFARNKDKGVYKIVRDKIQQLREEEKQQSELQARIDKLINAIAELSRSEYFPLYAAKLTALENDWTALEQQVSPEQLQRFNEYKAQCQTHIDARQAEEQAREQQLAREASLRNKAHSLYSELCALKESASSTPDQLVQVEQLESQFSALEQQWQEVEAFSSANDQDGFGRVRNQLLNLLKSYQLFFEQENELARLTDALSPPLENDKARKLAGKAEKLISRISWPRQISKPEALICLESALESSQKQISQQHAQARKIEQELEQELNSLKQAISSGEIRTADKQIKRAEQLSKRLNGQLPDELEQRIKTLSAELQEIRDWQAYAVAPKKEALCEEMESLSGSSLDVAELATQIKRIQKEWKLLDATDSVHSQQLWKRFKKASDEAYAPCDAHFAEQRDIRRHNLKQREAIYAALAQIKPLSTDEQSPEACKAYEDDIRQAKLSWKEHSPVDRAPGKKLQAEFDQLLQTLEQPLQAQQRANATAKQELIGQVQALLDSADQEQATEQVKQIQQQWKLLGRAPRNQERKLWQQFRELCNQVFERYYEKRSATTDQSEQLIALCEELEQLCSSNARLGLLQQKLTKAQQLSCTVDNSNVLHRLQQISDKVSRQEAALARFQTEPFLCQQRKAAICDRLEQAILNGQADTELTSIREAWNQECDDNGSEVDQRYHTLLQLIETPEQIQELLQQQELRLRQLCIRLEIAASQPSPTEDQALRMEYQMERLQQALAEQNQSCNLAEIKALEFEWLGVPFADQFEHLQARFQSQLQNLI